MFVSPEVSRRARHGKYGYKLGRRKKLYLDKHILKPFVPVAKNIFFLKQKKKNEYPLLTTKDDKTLKYVGSLSNSNVLHYDLARDGSEILFSSTVSDLYVFYRTCCCAFGALNRNHLVTLVAQLYSENAKPASL